MKEIKTVLFPTGKPLTQSFSPLNHEIILESRFKDVVSCRKINRETMDGDLEELRHLSFKEFEGKISIKDDLVKDVPHLKPLKFHKHNIGY